jgi:hypothetical protein
LVGNPSLANVLPAVKDLIPVLDPTDGPGFTWHASWGRSKDSIIDITRI